MAEQAETPKILEELSTSNQSKPRSRVDRKKQAARRRFVVGLLALLAFFVGIGVLAYQQYILGEAMAAHELEKEQLREQLAAQQARLSELEARPIVEAQQLPELPADLVGSSELDSLEATLSAEIARLNREIAGLETQEYVSAAVDDTRWQLAEVGYLLRMAGQTLQLQADVDQAITLLESADGLLEGADRAGLFAIRQSIDEELLALRSVELPDLDGIYSGLETLANQSAQVRLADSLRQQFLGRTEELVNNEVTTATESTGLLQGGLDLLGEVFVFRNWQESPQVIMSPNQEAQIRQSLRIMFEQAQLALLLRSSSQYQASLEKAASLMRTYVETGEGLAAAMLLEIEKLTSVQISPILPDISQSLSLLNQLDAGQ